MTVEGVSVSWGPGACSPWKHFWILTPYSTISWVSESLRHKISQFHFPQFKPHKSPVLFFWMWSKVGTVNRDKVLHTTSVFSRAVQLTLRLREWRSPVRRYSPKIWVRVCGTLLYILADNFISDQNGCFSPPYFKLDPKFDTIFQTLAGAA